MTVVFQEMVPKPQVEEAVTMAEAVTVAEPEDEGTLIDVPTPAPVVVPKQKPAKSLLHDTSIIPQKPLSFHTLRLFVCKKFGAAPLF